MNIDKNNRNKRKIENESIRLYLQKYLFINKLDTFPIKQNYYYNITFSRL